MNGPLVTTHNLQHIMMYAFFAIHPVFELGYYWRIDWLPPNLDYMSAILAYVMEAFLFHEHLLGRSSIDIQVCMEKFMLNMYNVTNNYALHHGQSLYWTAKSSFFF